MEITILMPCLNEAATIGICVEKSMNFLLKYKIDGEVLVSDNGSTDNSLEILKSTNARVVHAKEKGYGSALRYGIKKAKGKYIVMFDADDTYKIDDIDIILEKLQEGNDLVIGNRFLGGIEKGAMPLSHKIGVPFLTQVANILYGTKIGDYHCGLRGFNRIKFNKLNLVTPGMEFASEMIIKAQKQGYKIIEFPTTLVKDKRKTKSHLHTIRDGFRHLFCLIRCR